MRISGAFLCETNEKIYSESTYHTGLPFRDLWEQEEKNCKKEEG